MSPKFILLRGESGTLQAINLDLVERISIKAVEGGVGYLFTIRGGLRQLLFPRNWLNDEAITAAGLGDLEDEACNLEEEIKRRLEKERLERQKRDSDSEPDATPSTAPKKSAEGS